MGLVATYVDANTFTVATDLTTDFAVNRKVKCDCGVDGAKYGVVSASAYGDPNTTVDLTADSDDLTSNLTAVEWSVVKPGTAGNIPLHDHRDEDKGGLSFGWSTKPCNSKGNSFATVQAAITDLAGDGWVFVPTGTWSEALTIANNNVILFGAGWGSIIDGGVTGHAINVTGDNCIVRDLQCKTTPAGGNNYVGVRVTENHASIERVYVSQSDYLGIYLVAGGFDHVVRDCVVDNIDDSGVYIYGRTICKGNEINNCGAWGVVVRGTGDNSIFNDNFIDTTGDDGIYLLADADNCVVDGNRVTNWTNEGIDDDSGTSVIGDNDLT